MVVDFPNVMSKFIMFGMPLSQIIACATVNAARVFPSFDDRGTLNVGAPADAAILQLRHGSFEFLDNYKGTRTGRQRLFPAGTVLAGKQVERAVSDEMREVIEDLWPELAHKLPPRKP